MTDSENVVIGMQHRRRRRLRLAYNYTSSPNGKRKLPAIKFSGDYLSALGFLIDGYFDLTINDDSTITLKAVPQDENELLVTNEAKSQDQVNGTAES